MEPGGRPASLPGPSFLELPPRPFRLPGVQAGPPRTFLDPHEPFLTLQEPSWTPKNLPPPPKNLPAVWTVAVQPQKKTQASDPVDLSATPASLEVMFYNASSKCIYTCAVLIQYKDGPITLCGS